MKKTNPSVLVSPGSLTCGHIDIWGEFLASKSLAGGLIRGHSRRKVSRIQEGCFRMRGRIAFSSESTADHQSMALLL